MTSSVRQEVKTLIIFGVIVFIGINAFSWNPGWGGRTDRKPGREVERYFGWPACFYCDLWRSDHPHEIAIPNYFPPIPISREMYFVYSSGSVIAFMLNATLAACIVGVCLIFVAYEVGKVKAWMKCLGIGLAIIALMIFFFGNQFSTHL